MSDVYRTWKPAQDPWKPAAYDDDVVYAVRAVWNGTANDGQQKLVADWFEFLTGCGRFQDLSYRPGPTGDRDSAFAEGKRFVGLQLLKMLHPSVTPRPKHEIEANKVIDGKRRQPR